ncbi:MAG: potassium channel family protein [Roseinatronobacter sp.]
MSREQRSFVVVGLGAFGSAVASELARYGQQVLGIDTDEKRVAQLANTLSAALILDTSDEGALRDAGLDSYDVALIAIGRDIQSSILTTMNMKMLGIDTIWVKAANRTHHRILTKLGVDRVILPEQEMGRHVAEMLNNPVLQDYVSLGNGFTVVNVQVPERFDTKPVSVLGIGTKHDLRLLGMMRGTEILVHDQPESRLKTGDKLILLGKRTELRRFASML